MDDAAPVPAAPSHANTNDPPAGLDFVESHASALSELAAAITAPSGSAGALAQPKPGAEDGGQALESHEVVELQAFNERKDWIISKTKVLEAMPKIDIFAGLDELRKSLPVMALPTREELQGWVEEHDRIEKETEIFDSGDLRRLKQLTKAAAQRNLSPGDTDLIELALTTIFELDKLLHLLRDRSHALELMGTRLTWEERRVGAWASLASFNTDLKNFVHKRARWTPAVYDEMAASTGTPAPMPSPSGLIGAGVGTTPAGLSPSPSAALSTSTSTPFSGLSPTPSGVLSPTPSGILSPTPSGILSTTPSGILSTTPSGVLHTSTTAPSAASASGTSGFTLTRRESNASLASHASDTSLAGGTASRSARFRTAEQLTRDAAAFAGRLAALRHGDIAAAGKAIDALIDRSRRPVPEELLDEQDRLEAKGITEMENVGKFAMALVMQWKKADEFYAETLKDQASARSLGGEVDFALLSQPTARTATGFVSRAGALHKRVAGRADPGLTFPRPLHVLFPDQAAANNEIVKVLAQERASALDATSYAQSSVDDYQRALAAVKRVETLRAEAQALLDGMGVLSARFEQGFPDAQGDGTPPNLSSQRCLEKDAHSAFVALLPKACTESADFSVKAQRVLSHSDTALTGLDHDSIDPTFKSDAAATFRQLGAVESRMLAVQQDASSRVALLREARAVWDAVGRQVTVLEIIRREIVAGAEADRWRRQTSTGASATLLTPESQASEALAGDGDVAGLTAPPPENALADCEARVRSEAVAPAATLQGRVPDPLHALLAGGANALLGWVEALRRMHTDWAAVQQQAAVMAAVRADVDDLELRAESAKAHVDELLRRTLPGADDLEGEAPVPEDKELEDLEAAINRLRDSLPVRVPFVSRRATRRATPPSEPLTLDWLPRGLIPELPLDLSMLDDDVRTDSNAYAMRLGGEVRALQQKRQHLELARLAAELDAPVRHILRDVAQAVAEMADTSSALEGLQPRDDLLATLDALAGRLDSHSQEARSRIGRSFSPVRALLYRVENAPCADDAEMRDAVVAARRRAIDAAEDRFKAWQENATALRERVTGVRVAEEQRLEQVRRDEQAHREAEEHARLQGELDDRLRAILTHLARARAGVDEVAHDLDVLDTDSQRLARLDDLATRLRADTEAAETAMAFGPVREALHSLEQAPGGADEGIRKTVIAPRQHDVDSTEERVKAWSQAASAVQAQIAAAQVSEQQRLEQIRLQEQARREAEELARQDAEVRAQRKSNFDAALSAASRDMAQATMFITDMENDLSGLSEDAQLLAHLDTMSEHLAIDAAAWQTRVGQSLDTVKAALDSLQAAPGVDDPVLQSTLVSPRHSDVESLSRQFGVWSDQVNELRSRLKTLHDREQQRLERLRKEAEDRERLGSEFDQSLQHVMEDLDQGAASVAEVTRSLDGLEVGTELLGQLDHLSAGLRADLESTQARISQSLLAANALLLDLESAPGSDMADVHASSILPRRQAAVAARQKFDESTRSFTAVHGRIAAARHAEEERLDRIRLDHEAEVLRKAEEQARHEAEERAREEAEKRARVEAEERARLEAEERARTEAEERARQEAEERARRDAEEQVRLEAEEHARQQAEERARLEAEEQARLEAEEQARLEGERLRLEAEEAARRQDEERTRLAAEQVTRQLAEAEALRPSTPEDMFFLRVVQPAAVLTPELRALQANILDIRKRLQSLSIHGLAYTHHSSAALPDAASHGVLSAQLEQIKHDAQSLPHDAGHPVVQAELDSLHSELIAADSMIRRVKDLADLAQVVHACDNLLSDLLEHIDSFPAPPLGPLSSSYDGSIDVPPEEQMTARLDHTRAVTEGMAKIYSKVSDDSRAVAEYGRVIQMWSELEDMARDRMAGKKSRPPSAVSFSGRSSRASRVSRPPSRISLDGPPSPLRARSKTGSLSQLSAAPSKRGGFLAPGGPSGTPSRRTASGSLEQQRERSVSRQSRASTSRSVSGPLPKPVPKPVPSKTPDTPSSSRLYEPTFASRQRTNSTTSNASTARPPMGTPTHTRSQPQGLNRAMSPMMLSELSSRSRSQSQSVLNSSTRSLTSHSHTPSLPRSTWGRAPRVSVTSNSGTPRASLNSSRLGSQPKRKYVANPKSKIDVAVGEVVNKIPVNINISAVEDGWKDQSGKYWIGSSDPKLCFCRILRSQMVMVRVGGGWAELSKFLKEHYSDLLASLPEVPSRHTSFSTTPDGKWLNSSMLKEASPSPSLPRTPEPGQEAPLFGLSSPPRSVHSTPHKESPGASPLRAIQFMRKVGHDDHHARPGTPTRARPKVAALSGTPRTPATPAWRP